MARSPWRLSPSTTIYAPNKIVGGPETLRFLNPSPGPGIERAFMMRYGKHRAYTYTAKTMKAGYEGPFKKYFAQAWAQRQEPLWSCFVTTKFKGQEAKLKRTVRSWVTRKLRTAFVESMKRHGFNKDGEPLGGIENLAAIYGTVQFIAEEHIVKMKMADLERQMDFCVKKLIQEQRPDRGRTPAQRPNVMAWKGYRTK